MSRPADDASIDVLLQHYRAQRHRMERLHSGAEATVLTTRWMTAIGAGHLGLMLVFTGGTAQPRALAPGPLFVAPRTPSIIRADSVIGVFEGRTPCGELVNEFTGFPVQNCEKVKWRLTLFRQPSTGEPTGYLYEGTRTSRRGTLRTERRSGPGWSGLVYHLMFPQRRTISFLSIDDRVLVLLGNDMRALPGDASWSNVLNRVDVNR